MEQTQIFFDQAQRHDAQLDLLLHQGLGALQPTIEQKTVLASLRFHKGAQNAIKIKDLTLATRLSDRAIKAAVNALRLDFGVLIGSSKSATTGGYYLILTDEERQASAELPADEIRERAAWLRVLKGKHYVLDLLGQVQIDIEHHDTQDQGGH